MSAEAPRAGARGRELRRARCSTRVERARQQGAAPGDHLRRAVRHRDRALAGARLVRRQGDLRGRRGAARAGRGGLRRRLGRSRSRTVPPTRTPTRSSRSTPRRRRSRACSPVDGIRFIFTSFVSNFASFSVVAVIFVAMIGVGVAEEAGADGRAHPQARRGLAASALTFIIVFVGILSSVATDAGYLILIPLGAAAFLSVGPPSARGHGGRVRRRQRGVRA